MQKTSCDRCKMTFRRSLKPEGSNTAFYFLIFGHSELLLRWVQTCNVTAYRKAVMMQVTETIRSYGLKFHPLPHGVAVSCERYTLGFPVCYGSPSDVFATSSGFVHLYTLPFKEERVLVTCHVVRTHLLRP